MIVFLVTFCVFMTEALLHYNYGRDNDFKSFHFPDSKTLLQILITVTIFSYLNSRIIRYLARHYKLH
jgi:Mor family transcriptional regulator